MIGKLAALTIQVAISSIANWAVEVLGHESFEDASKKLIDFCSVCLAEQHEQEQHDRKVIFLHDWIDSHEDIANEEESSGEERKW